MHDSIFVPAAESEIRRRAITHALELATAVDASVHVLHVVSLAEASNVGVERIEQGQLYIDVRWMGEERIECMLPPTDEMTAPVTRKVMFGRPDKQIWKFIATEATNLVIMGSQEKPESNGSYSGVSPKTSQDGLPFQFS